MSPGFPQTQPPRFIPEAGPGKLRPVSIKVISIGLNMEDDSFVCFLQRKYVKSFAASVRVCVLAVACWSDKKSNLKMSPWALGNCTGHLSLLSDIL